MIKKILMKHWDIIQWQPKLKHIFNQPPIISYRKEKSLKDIPVHAKIPSISQQSQNQRSGSSKLQLGNMHTITLTDS